MFSFAAPGFALLIFLPFLAYFFLPASGGSRDQEGVRFPQMKRLRAAFSGSLVFRGFSERIFFLLASLLWISCVLALMQPQIVNRIENAPTEGYDIILAVDLSRSMEAMDFYKGWIPVSRFDIAKEVVGDFVKGRGSDRIGLVLFGSFAQQYAPLTHDHEAVVKMLNGTVISMAGDGTAIGDALGLSVKALRDRPEKSRVIILLTDGEDTASTIPPKQAAILAKQYGIKVYTIGIGGDGVVRSGFGGLARTVMDGGFLQMIAGETGGSFFSAKDTEALKKVYEKIDMLEKTKVEPRSYVTRTPLYRYPLTIAVISLFLMSVCPILKFRTKGGREKISKREVRHA